MRRGIRIASVALFVVAGVTLGAGVAAAQVDLAKALVGTWQRELQARSKKVDSDLTLVITSVKQEDGRWIADGRFRTAEGKAAPVKIDIDTSGSNPSLRWTAGSGTGYDVSLLDDKNLVGTATLTTSKAGRGVRDRSVKLEKKQ